LITIHVHVQYATFDLRVIILFFQTTLVALIYGKPTPLHANML